MASKLTPIDVLEKNGTVIITMLREPDRIVKEHEHFIVSKVKAFTKAVLSIKDVLGKGPAMEKDREQYNVYKKNLYEAAALNIAVIIDFFNEEYIEENRTAKFKDPTKEFRKMASLAAFAIYDLLPTYQYQALKSAIQSPFKEVRDIAIEIYQEHLAAGRDVYALFDADLNHVFKEAIRHMEQ